MIIPQDAALMRVYLNASDRWKHKPLYRAVVEAARERHLAGASAFLVDLSYGAHRRFNDTRSEYTFDIPVVVDFVDAPDKINAFRDELGAMIGEGLIAIRPVRVIQYTSPTEPGAQGLEQQPPVSGLGHLAEAESATTMKIEGQARRVTIYIGSGDTLHGKNLSTAIIMKCRELGLAGATASLGVLGFGKASRIHRSHLLGLSEDLPERIEIVDRAERIAQALPVLESMVQGGLIVVEDVEVVRYLHDPK